MKQIVFLFLLMFSYLSSFAQEQYTVNGKTYELKTAVEGELDLLWNVIDKHFHYYVKPNNGVIIELLNTKGPNNKYNEEYKTQLSSLTQTNTESTAYLNFTLADIEEFIKAYNISMGNSYPDTKVVLKLHLSLFGGVTNQPFVSNPDNITVPFFGSELEGLSSSKTSKHAGFFNIMHSFDHNDFKYSATQMALGYRYRFINYSTFNVYGDMRFATYTFSSKTVYIPDAKSTDVKESAFQIPCSFGLGADVKISRTSFITLAYNELFALFVDNAGNFPVNIALGYKLSL